MEDVLYKLWLSEKFNGVNASLTKLIELFGDARGIYLSKNFNNINGITERLRTSLLNKDLSAAKSIAEKMAWMNGIIIFYGDADYPRILSGIHNPPYVLYIKGKMPDFDGVLTIGVVGTRNSTDYGSLVTKRLASSLSKAGVITVSGLARGIDAAGAWASLNAGGITAAVIGNGIDIEYPPKNAELYRLIESHGCIISEYSPGTPPIPRNFPRRNRIIAGLSRGVLVTEAPKRSGALITARLALEEGRDIFAVPRNITDTYIGTDILIQQGAKLVLGAEDILNEYPYAETVSAAVMKAGRVSAGKKLPGDAVYENSVPEKNIHEKKASDKKTHEKIKENLTEGERMIMGLLEIRDMQIDEIARSLDLPAGEVNTRLVMLEMKGVARKLPGGVYRINI